MTERLFWITVQNGNDPAGADPNRHPLGHFERLFKMTQPVLKQQQQQQPHSLYWLKNIYTRYVSIPTSSAAPILNVGSFRERRSFEHLCIPTGFLEARSFLFEYRFIPYIYSNIVRCSYFECRLASFGPLGCWKKRSNSAEFFTVTGVWPALDGEP
jgi:hypothetical protein